MRAPCALCVAAGPALHGLQDILIFNMAVDSLAELEAITPDEEEVQAQFKQEMAAVQVGACMHAGTWRSIRLHRNGQAHAGGRAGVREGMLASKAGMHGTWGMCPRM